MKRYSVILLFLLYMMSCKDNAYIDNTIGSTNAEFANSSIQQNLSYTLTAPYTLLLPYQIFGNSLSNNDTIIVRALSSYFSKSEYSYDSIRIITPKTIFDTVKISIQSNKIWEGGTFSIPFELISKNKKIKVSSNYKQCTLYFTRESFISYFTGNYSCHETSTGATYDVSFTQLNNDSTVYNTNFWDFPLVGQQVPYIFRKDDAKSIEIPQTVWTDKLGNVYTVYGTGSYTFNGSFEVSFFMENSEGNIEHSGIHHFTKK